MNVSMFIGNLVRDPELRKVGANQVSLVTFTLAVDRSFTKKSGEEKKEVDYLDFELWDTGAETFANKFRKGSLVFVSSSARKQVWTDNEQNKRSRVVFRVDRFFGTGQESSVPATVPTANNTDEDIPF